MADDLKLRNLEFRGLIPKREVPRALEEADALIALIRDLPVLRFGINPTKLFDYMASGRPIIFGIRAPNNPVEEAGAGITIPPEDPVALSRAVRQLAEMPRKARAQMGSNGYEYVRKHHDIRTLTDKLEGVLQ